MVHLNKTRLIFMGLVFFLALSSPVQAQKKGAGSPWGLSLDLPAQFIFTGDVNGISAPSGFKLSLDTRFSFGVSTENYTVSASDPVVAINMVMKYSINSIYGFRNFSKIHLAAGVGSGSVVSDPFTVGAVLYEPKKASVSQVFISMGWPMSPKWGLRVGYSKVNATSVLFENGVDNGNVMNLSGVMHSIGVKRIF